MEKESQMVIAIVSNIIKIVQVNVEDLQVQIHAEYAVDKELEKTQDIVIVKVIHKTVMVYAVEILLKTNVMFVEVKVFQMVNAIVSEMLKIVLENAEVKRNLMNVEYVKVKV